MNQPRRPTEQYSMIWRGIDIIVVYTPDFLSSPGDQFRHCHLEVMSEKPGLPLPITETGYKSLFLPGGSIDDADSPLAFVTRWLDHAAKSKTWKAAEQAMRQGSLF